MGGFSRVLVTGGTGFLGAYLLRRLAGLGYRLRATRRANSRMDLVADLGDAVEWVEADVTDLFALEDAFDGVDAVCHCAAVVSFHPRDTLRMRQINIEGTANVVNLALSCGVRRLVHASSIAALGRTPEKPHLSENSGWVSSKLNTRYAITKYLSEQEVWRGHAEGLSVGIVNPSVILGAGHWDTGSPLIFRRIFDGMLFYPGGKTGFVDVRDVARFMHLLLDSEANGERYVLNAANLGNKELFDSIADALQKSRPRIKAGPLLAEAAWRVEWLKEKLLGAEPIVTRESARAANMQFTYDNQKSLAFPGFGGYLPVEQTIAETAALLLDAASNGFGPRMLEMR